MRGDELPFSVPLTFQVSILPRKTLAKYLVSLPTDRVDVVLLLRALRSKLVIANTFKNISVIT